MFETARLKLTAWYLLIIMVISIVFSVAFYKVATLEIERIIRMEEVREKILKRYFMVHPVDPMPQLSIQELEETEERLRLLLIVVNGGIFVLAGAAGYFLAGRTLQPIQTMVGEQHRFITDASHELRTPLTALRSEIEVGLRDKTMSVKEARILLESNLEEVISLQTLSDSLLQLSQTRNHKLALHKTQLVPLTEAAVKKVAPMAKQKNIAIISRVAEIAIYGDETSLIQLFIILLDNAIKYSPENSEITFSAKKTDQTAIISIQDQGIGIEKKDIPFIFDRFYRVDKARSRQEGGYGLGLSIAKKIVAEHNGTMQVKSYTDTGKTGTTFIMRLPVKHRVT